MTALDDQRSPIEPFNSTNEDDWPSSLSEVLVVRADRDPDSEFIFTLPELEAGDVGSRTYKEILDRANRIRTELSRHGVVVGEPIGCYLSNSPAWVVSTFAIWHSGAVIAAVGTLLPAVEARNLFEMAGVRVVIRAADAEGLSGEFEEILVDDEGLVESGGNSLHSLEPRIVVEPDATACIFFTSGTTGKPKGIEHTHAEFVDEARKVASAYAKSESPRPRTAPPHLAPGVVFDPFGHRGGYGRLGFRLWIGRPCLLIRKFSVAALKLIVTKYQFDSLQLTPAMVYMLATSEEDISLGAMKYVTSGTAPLASATRDRFEDRFNVPVLQAYGMTEVGSIATERFSDYVEGRRGPGCVGRLSKGVEVRIRDVENGAVLEAHESGEILVRAADMPTHFVGGAMVPVDELGWFATGDVGHLDELGILYISGRAQEKLIVGGFNVYPAEVEDAARRHDYVLDAVVVGLPDERLGEVPVIGVVWRGEPKSELLLTEIREQLAHYKVPRAVFQLNALPLTSREKLDRVRALEIALSELDSGTRD